MDAAVITDAKTVGLSRYLRRITWRAPYPVVVGLLLANLLVLDIASMQRMSITLDEGSHFSYGWNILNLDSDRIDNSKMPFSALNALPRKLAGLLRDGPARRRLEKLETGRYVTILGALLFALVVLRWSRELYGPRAGLLALFLYVFDPNIIAHSRLITTDLFATGMTTLALYCLWRFLNRGGWMMAWTSALTLGLAQLAKYTCAYLFPIFALIVLGYYLPTLWTAVRSGRIGTLASHLAAFLAYALFFVAVTVVVINIGFLGNRTMMPLRSWGFRSEAFDTLRRHLASHAWIRVPVPAPYLEGLDWVLADERRGANVYLLGQLGRGGVPGQRFPEYYLVAWLYKVPIGTQILVLASLAGYLVRFRRFAFRRNEWFLLCPVLFFALYFTFIFNFQIGIRFALVVFPLLYVFSGSLLADAGALSRSVRVGIGLLIAYVALSVVSYAPHFISYFNELVWDRKQAYKILSDSNIDWQQSDRYYLQYVRKHPEAINEPDHPIVGTFIVPVRYVTGVEFYQKFRWIRENGIEPVDHIAYSYLVFRITREDLKRIEARARRTAPAEADRPHRPE